MSAHDSLIPFLVRPALRGLCAAYVWVLYRIPTGAGWMHSQFNIVRRLGAWWLPRWYGLGLTAEERLRERR